MTDETIQDPDDQQDDGLAAEPDFEDWLKIHDTPYGAAIHGTIPAPSEADKIELQRQIGAENGEPV